MKANQTSFKPGKSGNPGGRPLAPWTMRGLILEALEEQDENGTPYKKVLSRKLVQMARKGDVVAMKEVNNRIDGMPKQSVGLEGSDGGPLVVKIVEEKFKVKEDTDGS